MTVTDEMREAWLEAAYGEARHQPHPETTARIDRGYLAMRALDPEAFVEGEPSKPPDRWESMALAGVPQDTMNQLGQEGWEPYAAAFNADGKQVIWLKRMVP